MTPSRIRTIGDFGQSIWLDFFDRKIMDTGALKRLIEDDGISGVTVNPSIFEKAIDSSTDYDEDIAALAKEKGSNDDIFFSLAVKDIQRAADLLSPVYERSKGKDGFVSLEVSPHLADDTAGTVRQARELWKAVGRKNVMIKIPGTDAGLPAIRRCLSEGININITLLFGLTRYKQVIEAYFSGLEDRMRARQPIDEISSVASFFLSRIDVLVDPLLADKGLGELKGEVAIASARKAYELWKEVFASERFRALEAKGAKPQRLLWASTSSKDPSFRDVKYVEALIGAQTINTIPMDTLTAFNDHGEAASRLNDDMPTANSVLARLKEAGIDLHTISQRLEKDGVEKFNKAYDKLLGAIEKQKEMVH
jgi:transaldolase/transaldolase/glucose-6-phosphate isomerase